MSQPENAKTPGVFPIATLAPRLQRARQLFIKKGVPIMVAINRSHHMKTSEELRDELVEAAMSFDDAEQAGITLDRDTIATMCVRLAEANRAAQGR
jgi:hypothetical protein